VPGGGRRTGIQPKDLPFVFDKFYGGASESDRRTGPGTGLGLALAKQVIEAGHGGRMYVRSVPGEGCCLGFDLDQAAAGSTEPAGDGAPAAAGRGAEPTR
jgi:signal transduction histidine kinase